MNAHDLVQALCTEVAPEEHDNRLVTAVAQGRASREVMGALAAEEARIVASDRRSFLLLAARTDQPAAMDFFTELAQGEGAALATLPALAAAAGLDEAGVYAYRVRAGCQAYPAYLAWLALSGDPVEVALAVLANFAAWGGYCATLARALREHYGFDDAACAFFDLFAAPGEEASPSPLEAHALGAIEARLAVGDTLANSHEYGRLLQSYERMFWNTLADAQ